MAEILKFETWKDSPCNTEQMLKKLKSQGSRGIVTSPTLGTPTFTGRAVGKDGAVYREDTVHVFIRPVSSLQLLIPSKKVLVGSRRGGWNFPFHL